MSVEPRNTPSLSKNYTDLLTDIQVGEFEPRDAVIETSPIHSRCYVITVDPTGYEYYLSREHFENVCKEFNLTPKKV